VILVGTHFCERIGGCLWPLACNDISTSLLWPVIGWHPARPELLPSIM
jgi:hypothetical protein